MSSQWVAPHTRLISSGQGMQLVRVLTTCAAYYLAKDKLVRVPAARVVCWDAEGDAEQELFSAQNASTWARVWSDQVGAGAEFGGIGGRVGLGCRGG